MNAITLLLLGAGWLQCYAFTDHDVQMYDAVLIAKCTVRCGEIQDQTCKNACLQERFVKPGRCPIKTEMSVFDTACLHACESDHECLRTEKCCTHSCGSTCQAARDLQNVTELPAIPREVTVTERRRRLVILDWSMYDDFSESDQVVFLIEERQQVGRHFSRTRMNEWVPRHLSYNTTFALHNILRPGHWYQFHVAAVNENGTKGFSEPSEPFTLSVGPKPPGPPQNLSVGSCEWINETLWCDLAWAPPTTSDLPVRRYKVFWSRRVHEEVASVLVNHQTVNWNVRTFLLKYLQPESLYFLQVQALAQFGPDKLKGEKAAIFLNTADYRNASAANTNRSALEE